MSEVTGDKFAAGFTVEAFNKCGVNYRYSDRSTSDYYSGLLPILNSRRCQLLDNKRLASQLCSLERRSARGGAKDSISHPPLGHDDLAAAVAGLMVRLVGQRDFSIKTWHVPFRGITGTELCAQYQRGVLSDRSIGLPGYGDDSSSPPGGWPAGSPQAGDPQFGWSINRRN